MWRRAATGRNVHIDNAEVATRVLAGNGNRVGIANETNMRQVFTARRCKLL